MFSPNLYPQATKIIGIVKGEETWLNLGGGGGCTVKSHFIDFINTRLIQAPNYYGQFALFLRKESPHIFLKFNRLILFIFLLLDSPIIGRVTATAWRQLLQACNSPSPQER